MKKRKAEITIILCLLDMRKYVEISGFLFAALATLPFFFMKEGSEIFKQTNDLHFILIETGLFLLFIDRLTRTKNPLNLILIGVYGAAMIIDSLNCLFDKSINSRPWMASITLISLICCVAIFFFQTKPTNKL